MVKLFVSNYYFMPPLSNLDKILSILSAVKDDEEKLGHILIFLESQILPEIEGVEISVKVYHCFSAKGTSVFDGVMAV